MKKKIESPETEEPEVKGYLVHKKLISTFLYVRRYVRMYFEQGHVAGQMGLVLCQADCTASHLQ